MCLTMSKYHDEQIATKDIPVFKTLRFGNKSAVQGFVYKPNTTYKMKKLIKIVRIFENRYIDEGFHSVYDIKYIEEWSYSRIGNHREDINLEKIVRFYIPKGAKYYIGSSGDIVSTSIRSGNLKSLNYRYN